MGILQPRGSFLDLMVVTVGSSFLSEQRPGLPGPFKVVPFLGLVLFRVLGSRLVWTLNPGILLWFQKIRRPCPGVCEMKLRSIAQSGLYRRLPIHGN